MFDKLGEKA
jgi:uncharacterized UBP type Zn finger protein